MQPSHKVIITGIGMVTPLGATASESAQAWRKGRCAIRQPLQELTGTPLEDKGVAILPDIDIADRLGGRKMLKYMSDAAVLGCLAAREALQDSDAKARFLPERIGIYAGTGLAAANLSEVRTMVEESIDENGQFSCRLLGARGLAATNPLLSFRILANMPPCLISIMEGIKGPNLIFTPWEGQTASALLEAWRAVSVGAVDCALAGAADSAANPATFVYLRQAGLLDEDEYPASGASYIVLERLETAERDGRRVYVQVEDMQIIPSYERVTDPLSERLGRTFAAAPAILLGLESMNGSSRLSMCGVDGQKFRVELKALG
jgi:3-oxoacyl-[acyl-carrier-protein] synthase II